MAFKIFLDANIILDFTLKRDTFEVSGKIIELIVNRRIQGFITPSIVHIVGYWLTKGYGNAKAKELLLLLLTDLVVIDVSHEVVLTALHSKITDIEDALQYYTALNHKLDYFISLDKKLSRFALPILPIYKPQEFLNEFES